MLQPQPESEMMTPAPALAPASRRSGTSRRRGGPGNARDRGAIKLGSSSTNKLGRSTMDTRVVRSKSVVVVGAGISGLVCASELSQAGIDVTVVEMGRGPGGRLATRRESGLPFDHGTQHFTCSQPQFAELVSEWVRADVVKVWNEGNFGSIHSGPDGKPFYTPAAQDSLRQSEKRFIGNPASNSMCKFLEASIGVDKFKYSTVVTKFEHTADGKWRLLGNHGDRQGADLGEYDVIIVSAAVNAHPRFERLYKSPPPLAAVLQPHLQGEISKVEAEPCFSLMLAYDGLLDLPFDLASFVDSPILARVSRENEKPGRVTMWHDGGSFAPAGAEASGTPTERLVLLSTAGYGSSVVGRLSINPAELPEVLATVGQEMLAAWQEVLAVMLPRGKVPAPIICKAHRWNAAFPVNVLQTPPDKHCMVDEQGSVIACGDYCVSPNVQGAALSGLSAAAEGIRMCHRTERDLQRRRRRSFDATSAGGILSSHTEY